MAVVARFARRASTFAPPRDTAVGGIRMAMLLTPPNVHHLALASQVGVTDIVAMYPGLKLDDMMALKKRVNDAGMKLSVIERHVPHDQIVHAKEGRAKQIEGIKTLIANMGQAGVGVLCYNWMPSDDWSRTSVTERERGGALVSAFDNSQQALNLDGVVLTEKVTPAEQLWENLEYFLKQVIPVAEKHNVVLALHPDDPPLPRARGRPQIMYSVDALEKATSLVKSRSNGICYCQGTLASANEDIVRGIHRLAPHIRFIHFRDIVGGPEKFRETFHDNGKTDMVASMRAYYEAGIEAPLRPDHAPTMDGETNENPGYEMLGRLYAAGYIKGLMQAVGTTKKKAFSR